MFRKITFILIYTLLIQGLGITCPEVTWAQLGGARNDPTMQYFPSQTEQERLGGSSFGSTINKSKQQPLLFPGTTKPEMMITGPIYQVHILGEVDQAGTYRVPASTRLSEAIEMAGGILDRGALRKIELRRKGKKTQIIDLLSFKLMGNLDDNPYLLDNDVVLVPLKDNVIQVAGAVKRPDTYEMNSKRTLYAAIKLAGGFGPGVALESPATIVRFTNGEKELLQSKLDKKSMKSFTLHNADVVVIPHVITKDKQFDYNVPNLPGDSGLFYPSFEERVFVIGAVTRPGPQSYSPYYSVREYITQAGGTSRIAKEKDMHIIRSTGETIHADYESSINPGDTIVVPERYMRPENWLTLVLGVSSTALGITTAILTLTR